MRMPHNNLSNHIYRPVTPEFSQSIMKLQAQISKIVGTHRGSEIYLHSMYSMGPLLAPISVVKEAKAQSGMTNNHMRAVILDDLPQTATEAQDIPIKELRVSKRNTLHVVLGGSVLRQETEYLDETIYEATGSNRNFNRFGHSILIAHVDDAHIEESLDLAEQSFNFKSSNPYVSLEPVVLMGQSTAPVVSVQHDYTTVA